MRAAEYRLSDGAGSSLATRITAKNQLASMNDPDITRSNVLALALIVPDIERRRALATAMTGSRAAIVREFGEYPCAGGTDELGETNCDVVVVDLDDDTNRAISLIEDICSHHPSLTVMAISARNDSNLLRRSMHAGAREFLVEPLLPEPVHEAMARAFGRRPQPKRAGGKMSFFVPTKGGVGVTTLTANFSLALASESGARVVVVDMDFQLGEIALGLGLTPAFSVVDALRNIDRLDREFLSTLLIRHSLRTFRAGVARGIQFFSVTRSRECHTPVSRAARRIRLRRGRCGRVPEAFAGTAFRGGGQDLYRH